MGGLRNGRVGLLGRSNLIKLVPLGLGLMAGIIIWVATPWGIGIEYDSVFYWSAAENLLGGRGLGRLNGAGQLIPLTHFPPLYPLAMAAVARVTGATVAGAARLLSAGLFGFNLFLLWRLVLSLGAGRWAALGSALVWLVAPSILERHLWAMSEPLYFTWLLCSLSWLNHSVNESGERWLVAAAATTGLASLTRYAGISLLATGVVAYLLFETRPVLARARRAALFAALAGVLPIAWQARNLLATGTPTNRVLLFHPPGLNHLREAGTTLAAWLPYPKISAEIRLGVLVLVGLGALVLWVRRGRHAGQERGNAARRMTCLAGLHGAVYLGFLGVSLTFFDASTRLRDRILSPLFLVGMLMIVGLLAVRSTRVGWGIRIAALTGFALLVVPYAVATVGRLQESRAGLGFVSAAWRNSETLAQIRRLDADLRLYSDEAFPIYFLTGKPASWVPERIDPVKGTERSEYRDELEVMHASVDAGEAALVLFHPHSLRPELPSLDELTAGLEPALVAADGLIYLAR